MRNPFISKLIKLAEKDSTFRSNAIPYVQIGLFGAFGAVMFYGGMLFQHDNPNALTNAHGGQVTEGWTVAKMAICGATIALSPEIVRSLWGVMSRRAHQLFENRGPR
jgi:hypothetical protein